MTSATRQRPAPGFAGNEFSDGNEVVGMAREVAEALQHTPCERAKRVAIRVLALQPMTSAHFSNAMEAHPESKHGPS
jgi:hypothetical protein